MFCTQAGVIYGLPNYLLIIGTFLIYLSTGSRLQRISVEKNNEISFAFLHGLPANLSLSERRMRTQQVVGTGSYIIKPRYKTGIKAYCPYRIQGRIYGGPLLSGASCESLTEL